MSARHSPAPPAAATARPKASTPPVASPAAGPSTSTAAASSSSNNLALPGPSMPAPSRPGRGATPTASRPPPPKPAAQAVDKPARPSSRDSLKQQPPPRPAASPRPARPEEVPPAPASPMPRAPPRLPMLTVAQQLSTLKSDLDGLRAHLTCKICDRLLYQPFTIACGHTYCYSCLCTWFQNNKSRKTCPDCRAPVTQQPAPAYVVRDMTTLIVARAELLPTGETVQQHKAWQQEEATAVQQDRDNKDPRNGGLFKGCFRTRRPPSLHPIRDQEDGVDRCPMCSWELEDGECAQCGLFMDDNGELTWGDSFTGFSDLDEASERDMSGEDVDADMDFDDGFDGYDDHMDAWDDYNQSFMMQRFLEQRGLGRAVGFRPPRRMTHSEAGSMRSYSQSIVSDMYADEMDTVEEEDEEDEEDEDGMDEDSSMNDFIDDDEEGASSTSRSASSTPGQTPRPTTAPPRTHGRVRRIVESEAPSTISSIEEEEDEEDQGPIRRGQRNRAQARALIRANGSRETSGAPSSTSTDTSGEQELDEDTQALLQAEGWMLQHDGLDEEMDEDDESDGGRTTVGWDATAISNDRFRMGGSLTPTADRPRPNAPIRPPSRVGHARFMDASRGLRRRSSIMSTSTVSYEDGEADDDDSDLDQDGDMVMAMNALRQRRSRIHLRPNAGLSSPTDRFAPLGTPTVQDGDESDTSQSGNRRNGPRTRPQEYNPRISWMFANHQRALQEHQGVPTLLDLEQRSTTPIARPRTANRNRTSPGPQFSPFMAPGPARLRTPMMDNTSNAAPRNPISPPRRSMTTPTFPANEGAPPGLSRAATDSSANPSNVLATQQSVNATSQAQVAAAADVIDRPMSRLNARPPSASGRRNSAGLSPVFPVFPAANVGLSLQGHSMQTQRPRNPWGNFMQQATGVRTRTSRPALREQSSTATLRPANSRASIREAVNPASGVRPQPSRLDLRNQPSRRRLNNQSSTRTLRASDHARPPQPSGANAVSAAQPSRPTRLSPDEREVLARELINTRMRALNGAPSTGSNPMRNNPFAQGLRRANPEADGRPAMTSATGSYHTRSNSSESMNSGTSSSTAAPTPTASLNRRRSSRNMGGPGQPALVTAQEPSSPTLTFSNNYFRARQGSLISPNPPFQPPINRTNRTPMVAAAAPLI